MAKIQHEPPSQRLHFRVAAPAAVVIGGVTYMTVDWSLGGFLIDQYQGTVRPGDRLSADFTINFQGFEISMRKDIEVVRVEADKNRVACRFLELGERERELLHYYVTNLMTGQMTSVEEVIKRIDTPVKPVPLTPDEKVAESVPLKRQSLRRAIFSVLYFTGGAVLGIFLLLTLYGRLLRLDVESAVVTRVVEQIVSKDVGIVGKVAVTEGAVVQPGEVLLVLEDDVIARELETRQQQLDDGRLALAACRERMAHEGKRLAAYREMAVQKLTAARETVSSDRDQLATAQAELARARELNRQGFAPQSVVDEAASRVAHNQGDLDRAVAELGIAEEAMATVRRGFFYTGRELVGDQPSLVVEEERLRRSIPLLEERLREAQERAGRLTYLAPFLSRVMKVTKSAGSTAARGETLVVLEKLTEDPVVDAFVTQNAAAYVEIGAEARVIVPALNRRLRGKVISVDRTFGFRTEMKDAYEWRVTSGASAHVRLALLDLSDDTRRELVGGLPALVNMPRSFSPGILR